MGPEGVTGGDPHVARRRVVLAGVAGGTVMSSLILPSAAWATSGDSASATTLTIESTFADDGTMTVTWTDSGTA